MKQLYLVLLFLFPIIVVSFNGGSSPFAAAASDDDDVDDDVDVEGDGEDTSMTDEGGDDEDGTQSGASPDALTTLLFTKPSSASTAVELPAGQIIEFLVGFHNKGKQDFIVETLDASFRYPMDYSFYIQNFSMIAYNRIVKPTHEATLAYSFMTPESFAGRPFGLNIHLSYRDFEGNAFSESVFNETVNIIEIEEALDCETLFLYVFLAALVVLLLVIGQYFLVSVGKKRVGKKPVVETGTTNPNDVDYEWLPKEMLSTLNKMSPKSSPRGGLNHRSPKTNNNKYPNSKSSLQQSPNQGKSKKVTKAKGWTSLL
ncbi:translocon-associated protein subunit alpha precursor, putative [Pediculus humanus corporis]|uniref:Translocon-associated protein subunit alpha n=1 Tax=Pediculus humanus subsp. corporis TaxID=121224 RepID=E0VLV3_PEDHC|nr:translocon-associated protein subunit alpha precursor, putative [Pediculus humanus corporis]EEB14359.1 translocon-associated protein subunit alpha precursor, putative [Pediculus humanus corporis]